MIGVKHASRALVLPAVMLGGLLAGVPHAGAVPITTVLFDDAVVQGGTLSYDGMGGPLTGAGVTFDTVLSMGTTANTGIALTCEGCTLSFTTGSNAVDTPSFWAFAPGGSALLTGTAKSGASAIASGTLISGVFNDFTYVFSQGPLNINVSASMDMTLDADLAAFYGAPTSGLAVITQINVKRPSSSATNAFQGTSTDTDINYYVLPVPAALPLFLTALGGIAMIAWRRQSVSPQGPHLNLPHRQKAVSYGHLFSFASHQRHGSQINQEQVSPSGGS